MFKVTKCSPVVPNLSNDHKAMEIRMVVSCPLDFDQNILDYHKCVNPPNDLNLNSLPVVGSDGFIYQNRYCAGCNSILNFETLNMTAECDRKVENPKSSNVLDVYIGCKFNVWNRVEDPIDITTCDNHHEILQDCRKGQEDTRECRLCQSYTAVTENNGTFYKNIHCQRQYEGYKAFQFKFVDKCLDAEDIRPVFTFKIPRYSMYISFATEAQLRIADGEGDDNTDTTKTCPDNKIFDAFVQECILPVCGVGYIRSGSTCTKIKDKVDPGSAYSPVVLPDSLSNAERCLLSNANKLFFELDTTNAVNVTLHFNNFVKKLKVLSALPENCHLKVVENRKKTSITFYADQIFASIALMSYNKIKQQLTNFNAVAYVSSVRHPYITDLYRMDLTRSFANDKTCMYTNFHPVNISENCKLKTDNISYEKNEYVLLAKYEINGPSSGVIQAITCDEFYATLACPMRRVDDYNIGSNNSVMDIKRNKTYKKHQYQLLSNGVGVCIDGKTESLESKKPVGKSIPRWVEALMDVERIITLIGIALSFIGYIWTMVTYGTVRELRKTPGKNIICICLTLLIADMLVLITMAARENYKACKVVGIVLHWALLSVQFWAAVIAFDILATFRSTSLSRNMYSKKKLLSYMAFAWGIPTIAIIILVILDETGTLFMGYGSGKICWIASRYGRIGGFIAPFVLSIIFTTLTLSYTIHRIRTHTKKSKKLLKKSGGENFSLARMALKLVLLLGVIEVLGLIHLNPTSDAFMAINAVCSLLYTVLRSFRGVFIWLLYIVTDRVFGIYRQRSSRYRSTMTKSSLDTDGTYVSQSSPESRPLRTQSNNYNQSTKF